MIEIGLLVLGGVLAFVTKNKRWLILWLIAFVYFWVSVLFLAVSMAGG